VMGIQLVARANDAGLALSPEQLFEHQTIAELAAMVAPMESLAEAGPAVEEASELDLAAVGLEAAEMDEVLAQLGEAR
jgi:Phosphopantetheine attachment site